ncbi:phage portal protein [Leuconostoc suionicum]|uniref:phage portal protein n=1 Tax=Leuconostoc suionicum TaxID=1511761 RepID=UPI00233F3628|nr:phage portal protein [Leuconostoc suionicum]MDC2815439.1 phage portal protein [Leuconostoc suionicum]
MAFFGNKTEKRSSVSPSNPVIFVPSNGFTIVTAGEQVVNAVPALQSAVSVISNSMASVQFTGGQQKVLNRVNFTTTYRDLLINGQSFMLIKKSSNGIITDLVPVNNSDVTINLNRGVVTYTINNTSGDSPYSSGIYDENEVLNFVLNPGLSDIERYVGHSPIESLKTTLLLNRLAQEQIKVQLQQSIQPKLLLKLGADTNDEVKAKIKQQFLNDNNNSSAIITDSKLDVSKLFTNDSNNDNLLNLSKQLSISVDEIATAFNVPSSKIGSQQTDDAQSSVQQIQEIFFDSLIHNYLNVIINELKTKVNDSINLDLTELVDYDNSKLIQQTIDLVGAGIVPTEEAYKILVKRGVLNG